MSTKLNKSPSTTEIWPTILSKSGIAGPLACRAAVRIINETCNPALRHSDAHNVTASLIAQVIHRETAADELLLELEKLVEICDRECLSDGSNIGTQGAHAVIAKTRRQQ